MIAEVGVRALKQNASALVKRSSEGEVITITDRGRPVALITPIAASVLERMVAAGQARPPVRSFAELPAPEPGPSLSAIVAADRDAERY